MELHTLCRMCISDLSQVAECYSIDDELGTLISETTGIFIDRVADLPLLMCTACVSILNKFNESRLVWIENQLKLEMASKAEDPISEDQFGIIEESQEEEYEYKVEYVDELEFDDAGESIEVATEEFSEADEHQEISNTNSKKTSGKAYKGKEVYRKLLQQCPLCSKKIEKNRMEGHVNKHQGIRPYTCEDPECGKTFFCKLLLRLHRTSLHTDQTIECKICSKTFKSERSLYTHNLRHKNENRYACKYCERKFNNNNSLHRHLAIHSGIREFRCEHCSSAFYRKFNLDTHIRTVHQKDKSYCCEFCPKSFGYARLLREHSRKHHAKAAAEVQNDVIINDES